MGGVLADGWSPSCIFSLFFWPTLCAGVCGVSFSHHVPRIPSTCLSHCAGYGPSRARLPWSPYGST